MYLLLGQPIPVLVENQQLHTMSQGYAGFHLYRCHVLAAACHSPALQQNRLKIHLVFVLYRMGFVSGQKPDYLY